MENIIKVERAKKKITQQELAGKVGCTKQSICNIEVGKQDPKLSLAQRISKFFGLPVEEIFIANVED